jgi:predicted transposase YbfD/YdcC
MVERKIIKGENQSVERQYYISSLDANAEKFHHLVRNHWSIENQLHWVLDATFHEDRVKISKDHSPQNLSLLRKIALALVKKDSSQKASLRRKQNIAGWNDDFLARKFPK